MARKTQPSEDDVALFRNAVKRVTPLRHDKAVAARKRVAPVPRQKLLDERQVMLDMLSDDYDPSETETGDELLYSRSGLQHGVLRKLRRGQIRIERELDLHGMTVAEARPALARFLAACQNDLVRCVRIVHGKGRRSPHQRPVLKSKLPAWLRQRDEVLAYCSAPRTDGGTGAVYVLLKRGTA
ncbi:MAG: Smr/MutS family protein [Gammaproteobacteria bacterium]|nr:Smr/MutS family protein [Gammaproteobacteria bacterium]